jgi:pyruvate kinase
MLSGESASGKYPVRSVQVMSNIIRATEQSSFDDGNRIPELEKRRNIPSKDLERMTAQAVYNLVLESKPRAIVLENTPISFVGKLTNLRPPASLLGFFGNHNPWTRKFMIFWGITPYFSRTRFTRALSSLLHYIKVDGKEGKHGWEFAIKIVNKDKTDLKVRTGKS